ncbi:cupin domain-containing protein [Neorhizobium petrolearium]|uniref:cupin domain-containing protein n=1 Tax=Neorhizobium petrolearium TaxID=515361 RepID=UPI003F80A5BE
MLKSLDGQIRRHCSRDQPRSTPLGKAFDAVSTTRPNHSMIKIITGPNIMIESPNSLPRVDRLTAFFDAFELGASLEPAPISDGRARLFVIGEPGGPAERIVLHTRGDMAPEPSALMTAAVDFEGAHNPLMNALPDQVVVGVNAIPTLRDTTAAFMAEALESRCGRSAALNRLCEVIVLLILRSAIDSGATGPGLLGGPVPSLVTPGVGGSA